MKQVVYHTLIAVQTWKLHYRHTHTELLWSIISAINMINIYTFSHKPTTYDN